MNCNLFFCQANVYSIFLSSQCVFYCIISQAINGECQRLHTHCRDRKQHVAFGQGWLSLPGCQVIKLYKLLVLQPPHNTHLPGRLLRIRVNLTESTTWSFDETKLMCQIWELLGPLPINKAKYVIAQMSFLLRHQTYFKHSLISCERLKQAWS